MTGPGNDRGLLSAYRRAYSGLPREVWLLAFTALVDRAGTMVVVFLPVWLVRVHGFEDHAAISFMGLFGGGCMVGSLVGGWLADRLRPLPVQIGSLVGVALGFACLSGAEGPLEIGALIFLIGLAEQAFRPANHAMLAAVCEPAVRMRAFGLHRLALNLGWTIGPVFGGLLSELGWNLLFWTDALTCLAAGGILAAGFRGRGTTARKTAAEHDEARPRSPLKDPLFLALTACMLLVGVVFMQFFSTLTIYLSEGLSWRPAEIGALQAVNPILIVICEMLLVQRFANSNPLAVVAAGAALIAFGFGLLHLSPATGWIVVCIVLMTFGEMLHFPFVTGFVANRAPERTRGRYMALHGLAYSLALVLAPVLGGWIREQYGWTTLWITTGVIGLTAAGAIAVIAGRARTDPGPDR